MAPGYMWSALLDADVLKAWSQEDAKGEESTMLDKVLATASALTVKKGFAGQVYSEFFGKPTMDKGVGDLDERRARAGVRVERTMSNIDGENFSDLGVAKTSQAEVLGEEIGAAIVKHQPFFGAAIRGLVGMWSAYSPKGEATRVLGIDATQRDVVSKFLGFGSRIWDPRFADELTRAGQEKLTVLKDDYKEFLEKAKEIGIKLERSGGDINKKYLKDQQDKAIDRAANIGTRIKEIQYGRHTIKLGQELKVATFLERVKIATNAMARGGKIDPLEAELLSGESPYNLPRPEPVEQTPIQTSPKEAGRFDLSNFGM